MYVRSLTTCIMRPIAIFLINLLLLQNVQVFMCRQTATAKERQSDELSASSASSSSSTSSLSSSASLLSQSIASAASASPVYPLAKRTINAGAGQPEEMLHLGDQMDSNYDEYPMIVPKRAALLLDRLMVALHHALEQEQSGRRRIVDLYMNKNAEKERSKGSKNILIETPPKNDDAEGTNYNQYSDDDPSVIMDYDFKDLNSINRVTGETLMAKSFQRRALGMDIGGGSDGGGGDFGMANNDLSILRAAAAASDEFGIGSYVGARNGGGGGGGGGGRVYWRCYFNAVSCF